MTVIVGYPGYMLADALAHRLGLEKISVFEKMFPDGEMYVRLAEHDKVRLEDVILISTLYPEQEKRFLKTLLLIDAVKNNNPRRVTAVIPYLAYSRQDRIFMPGEPVSACAIVRSIRVAGADTLVTVDVHSPRVLECFGGATINVMTSDLLVKQALRYVENPVVIAPDKGAFERASFAAKTLGLEYDYLVKQRDKVTGEITYMPREITVHNRNVVIVDDIISTGGTIAEASKVLLKHGAKSIVVVATHGLLAVNAISKLEKIGLTKIILADTLAIRHEHPLIEYVDVSERIASVLRTST